MPTRAELLQSVANRIADYRAGERLPSRTPDIVDQWVQQFHADTQLPLLEGLDYVFERTYISRESFKNFLRGLANTRKLDPNSQPQDYWRRVNILNIQRGGNSQRDLLGMFGEVLQETHGFTVADTGSDGGDFIYLDDCVGTGNRVRNDLCHWIENQTPNRIKLHIITPILYAGSWWIDQKINETAAASGKTISITKWRLDQFAMENRRAYRNSSDVLWPTAIPDHPAVRAYAQELQAKGHPPELRAPGVPSRSRLFRDDAQRILLEQAFLTRGCQIRQECTNLPDSARPLGYHNLDCFGFGNMFITFRNCPNNCPLALWVQQQDFPSLLPRRTNTQTANQNFARTIFGAEEL
jgi:hypothetical protein